MHGLCDVSCQFGYKNNAICSVFVDICLLLQAFLPGRIAKNIDVYSILCLHASIFGYLLQQNTLVFAAFQVNDL